MLYKAATSTAVAHRRRQVSNEYNGDRFCVLTPDGAVVDVTVFRPRQLFVLITAMSTSRVPAVNALQHSSLYERVSIPAPRLTSASNFPLCAGRVTWSSMHH